MKGPGILLILTLVAAWSSTSFARLGEGPDALRQRYGDPLSSGTVGAFTQSVYQKSGFSISVFYQDGVSVLETFSGRLQQADARKLVASVAGTSALVRPAQCDENVIRKAAGITCKDEVFWTWNGPAGPMSAAFNPVECSLSFFSQPPVYLTIHEALANAPL